ncbi:hypothetical protein BMF94_6759 [Rhodotorula taiwanensis]|uniref:Sugar phosphate transporter domain-containing protein n=1 Tax=Rhodotorula taiwanensis TaxID=741276 RepID=A0A2S5B075_9BASI|nr:hypothetical protein BMF94_6759 [Rhodotorula taiwanensis]
MTPPPPAAQGPSRRLLALLVTGMLVSGCSNSLWSKWQDMQCVGNCDAHNPAKRRLFEQPVYQTITMFAGETLCLIAFTILNSRFSPAARRRHRREAAYEPLQNVSSDPTTGRDASSLKAKEMSRKDAIMFWLPAMCDNCATTCMNVGLFFVPVSVYQMLRGALVLWVGIFSVLFLHRRLTRAQWTALVVCVIGVAVVGSSSLISHKRSEPETQAEDGTVSPLVGIALILVAQLFTASQFVIEERIMEHHSVEPLLAAGYEGICGFITTVVILLIAYWLYGSTPAGRGGYFDALQGFHEIIDNRTVWTSSLVIACSIALFNFCGLAVTRSVSATARSTIDSCRTLLIWAVSLLLGWETFNPLQIIGFALLVYGTMIYNGVTSFPHWTGLHRDELPGVPHLSAPSIDLPDEDDEVALANPVEVVVARAKDGASRSRSGARTSVEGERAPLLPHEEA